MHHRQTQAGALARGLGGEEGFEQPLHGRCVHAAAVVAHREAHVDIGPVGGRARCRAHHPRWRRCAAVRPQFDVQRATGQVWHGLPGVGAQVEQHLLHLRGVGQHRGCLRVARHPQHQRSGQGGAQQPHRLVHHRAQRDHAPLQHLAPAERQDALHQIARAATGLEDFLQADGRRVVALHVFQRQPRVAQDRGHDVVEVVRHAAGQRAQGFEFLRFAQLHFQRQALVFGGAAFGQVEVDAETLHAALGVLHEHLVAVHLDAGAVLAPQPLHAREHGCAGLHHVLHRGLERRVHVGWHHQVEHAAPQRFLLAEPVQPLGARVPVGHDQVGPIALHGQAGHVVEDLAVTQRRQQLPAPGRECFRSRP